MRRTASRILKRLIRWKWRIAALFCVALVALRFAGCTGASPTDRAATLPDGRELAYAVTPSATDEPARRVILVHGAPAHAASWNKLLRKEAGALGRFEVISVDRLGYGNSTPGTEDSLEAHAKSLEPLLTPGVVLVGHSYGGPVVLRAAAEFPDKVGGIVLAAGACDPYMNDSQWARRLGDAFSFLVDPTWATANLELLALTDENRATEPMLDRVRCRVAFVHGTWDPVCPHDGTLDYLKRTLGNASGFHDGSLERVGHNVHLSHTAEIVDAVIWCAEEDRPSG